MYSPLRLRSSYDSFHTISQSEISRRRRVLRLVDAYLTFGRYISNKILTYCYQQYVSIITKLIYAKHTTCLCGGLEKYLTKRPHKEVATHRADERLNRHAHDLLTLYLLKINNILTPHLHHELK